MAPEVIEHPTWYREHWLYLYEMQQEHDKADDKAGEERSKYADLVWALEQHERSNRFEQGKVRTFLYLSRPETHGNARRRGSIN